MYGSTWAIVVAAGRGTRFGGAKQFATIAGKTVVALAVEAAAASVDAVALVLPVELVHPGDGATGSLPVMPLEQPAEVGGVGLAPDVAARTRVVAGGDTRAGSVRAGLGVVPPDCEVVVVHDAARPLASAELCRLVIDAVRAGAAGAVPGVALSDTVKRVRAGEVAETIDRSDLVRVQTPQAFSAALLRRAHDGEPEATDDAGLVERMGGRVVVVPGEEWNVKITAPHDLELVASWFERSSVPGPQR